LTIFAGKRRGERWRQKAKENERSFDFIIILCKKNVNRTERMRRKMKNAKKQLASD
jgi:protein-tyrosine-phosphatase